MKIKMSDELKSWIDDSQRWQEFKMMEENGCLEWITPIHPPTGDPSPNQFLQLRFSPRNVDPGF
jgi:hypothetical protein